MLGVRTATRDLMALALWASACGASAAPAPPGPELQLTMQYPNRAAGRVPAVLVIGGAEGGDKWARAVAGQLAAHGYAAAAQAYFAGPGLETQLQQIPIERLRQGIDRLAGDPRVDPRRIAVLGFSKGAEAALVLAGLDRRIHAVVAGSPTDVVWQGIDRKSGMVQSSWTSLGRPMAFVPFAPCSECRSLGALYAKSHKDAAAVAAAAIPVETIQGPILLLASRADAVWPSEPMAEALQLRLQQHGFKYRIVLLRYPDGGHFTLGPPAPEDAKGDADLGGGTADGVVAARRQSWPQVLSFLDRAFHLRPGG